MEKNISFPCDDINLSGLFDEGMGTGVKNGVVVTHPHPLYGGDMYNPVVEEIIRTYRAKGWATLRFNFRGTGASGGRHDEGYGEQEDIAAALTYMRNAGIPVPDLAGYSFGAWVCARCAAALDNAHRMIMVSPPVAMMDFAGIEAIPQLALVITGSLDEIAPPDLLHQHLPIWNPDARFSVIEGADHFFSGWANALGAAIEPFVSME
ncbi:MAG: alpha/beta fold hydrolase [Thermodesulfobacteriota bacterium]|nr:alpha/beta fold hydrolase [Thermodesulfobacteriota bacterium]